MTRASHLRPLAALVLAVLACSAARAERYGGIELGAKGVKAVVLDIEAKPEGNGIAVVFSQSENVGLAAALDADGRLDPQAAAAAAAKVRALADLMKQKHQVRAGRIRAVGSSGLFAAVAGQAEKVAANEKALAAAVTLAAGLPLAFLDADREAALSIAGLVPTLSAADGLLVDVGGGNTKGGYRIDGGKYATFGMPFGTSTFHDAVKKQGGAFPAAAAAVRETALVPALRKALATDAGFAKRKRVVLSGGAVWATATFIHPADRSDYTPLAAADFDAMAALLAKGGTPDLSGIADPAAKAAAEKEIAAVGKVYTRDQLAAGVEILRAVAAELDFAAAGKTLAFARQGQYGWIAAYVLEAAADPK